MATKKRKKGKKSGRRKKTRMRRVLRGVLLAFLALFFVGIVSAFGLITYVVSTAAEIDPKDIYKNLDKSSYMYDAEGELIDTLYYTEDRKIISIDDMPADLKNAFIAIEDKTFYKHHGFNFRRMFGAVLSSFKNDSAISGTSTITQQLARNVYLPDIKSQRTINRKLTEMYYAWQIENALSKDEILEAYLNTIYLGYGCYGVNAAAKTYFSKTVPELDLAECAALAALPQAPDTYALIATEGGDHRAQIDGTDLYTSDYEHDRRDMVLDLMMEQGYITPAEADGARTVASKLVNPDLEEKDSKYTYFSDYVTTAVAKDLVSNYGMTEDEATQLVYTGGLKIYTTIDSRVQDVICEEFSNDYNFPSTVDWTTEVQASMVVTEVGTGRIRAMVGGRNTSGSKLFNRAISPRQPGSSIKPLASYGAALQKSYECQQKGKKFPFVDTGYDRQGTTGWGDYITANSKVVDERMYVNGNEWPQNVTRSYSGTQTFRTALQKSINTCAVKILLQVGVDYSAEQLKKFGLEHVVTDTSEPVNDLNPAALGLGAMTYGVTPLEMSLAYAVFPNRGILNSPVCYSRVEDAEGTVILTGETTETRVLDEGVAWIMTDVLKSVVSNGLATPAAIYGTQVGGKTGTTNDCYDVWFDGFTPKYSASLWIGTDKNVKMNSRSEAATKLWGRIMRQMPDVREGSYPEQPSNVIKKGSEYFTRGTEPNSLFSPTHDDRDDDDDEGEASGDNSGYGEEIVSVPKPKKDSGNTSAPEPVTPTPAPAPSTSSGDDDLYEGDPLW